MRTTQQLIFPTCSAVVDFFAYVSESCVCVIPFLAYLIPVRTGRVRRHAHTLAFCRASHVINAEQFTKKGFWIEKSGNEAREKPGQTKALDALGTSEEMLSSPTVAHHGVDVPQPPVSVL